MKAVVIAVCRRSSWKLIRTTARVFGQIWGDRTCVWSLNPSPRLAQLHPIPHPHFYCGCIYIGQSFILRQVVKRQHQIQNNDINIEQQNIQQFNTNTILVLNYLWFFYVCKVYYELRSWQITFYKVITFLKLPINLNRKQLLDNKTAITKENMKVWSTRLHSEMTNIVVEVSWKQLSAFDICFAY